MSVMTTCGCWIGEMKVVWRSTRVAVCSCVLRADALGQVLVPVVAPPQRHGQLPLDLPHALHQRGQGGPRRWGGRGSHCTVALWHTQTNTPVMYFKYPSGCYSINISLRLRYKKWQKYRKNVFYGTQNETLYQVQPGHKKIIPTNSIR